MTTARKKPGVAFWATVVAGVLLVGYPLSIGPVKWWKSRKSSSVVLRAPLVDHPQDIVSFERRPGMMTVRYPLDLEPAYAPIEWLARKSRFIDDAVRWYIDWWQKRELSGGGF
jgi:hypothetical protein